MISIGELDIAHEEAIQYIKKAQTCESIGRFTCWLMNTEIQYHNLFEPEYKNFESASGLRNFLCLVEERLTYENDICFPVINGKPKLLLCSKNFVNDALIQMYFPNEFVGNLEISFLDSIDEFIDASELYNNDRRTKSYFLDPRADENEKGIN